MNLRVLAITVGIVALTALVVWTGRNRGHPRRRRPPPRRSWRRQRPPPTRRGTPSATSARRWRSMGAGMTGLLLLLARPSPLSRTSSRARPRGS